ncbi:MAG: 5'-nucleotidase C-terminal domain-containing protein [Deltaproteobacteria bacterium]|nr:5'-nucleotidase C-terminal domain-containing protein [Deltaproteobacteria bacterium]
MKKTNPITLLLIIHFVFLLNCNGRVANEIHILHFNDVVNIESTQGGKIGGAARAAAVIKQYKGKDPLILFSGDAFGGAALSNYYKGAQVVDVFNRLGVDYAVCGNHEFDFEMTDTVARFKKSQFTWLCANMLLHDLRPIEGTSQSALIDRGGIKVGLIGVAGDWLESVGSSSKKIRYVDHISTAQRLAQDLKTQGAKVIIALTHMRLADDEMLLKKVPEINLILGGHDHEFIEKKLGDQLIWKTGMNWQSMGIITLTIDAPNHVGITARNIPIDETWTPDPTMAGVVASYTQKFDQSLSTIIGTTTEPLDTLRTTVRRKESNFGNYVTDVFRKVTNADISIINGGGIRSGIVIPKGPLTLKDIYDELPFDNRIVTLAVTGEELYQIIEHGFKMYPEQYGAFPHVSGIRIIANATKPAGQRVETILINNTPVIKEKQYTLATNNFIAKGGDGYPFLSTKPLILDENAGPLDFKAVTDDIIAKKVISPKIEGRIVIKGSQVE